MSYNDDDLPALETTEHMILTPPLPVVSNTDGSLPPRSQGRKNRSNVWNHFTSDPELLGKKAICNYCQCRIKCDNGTSSMLSHSLKCKSKPSTGNTSSSPSLTKFDQEKCRNELVNFFVVMELPFHLVEHQAFLNF
ncbi:hypothetical protein Fmac_006945 [Flemingia macrophylla]|uniref:BED-type domain-containing protein n=1 Tax=Flemingia macrophylla TaxID=520843 RepID=A0ABD1NC11_9FABA